MSLRDDRKKLVGVKVTAFKLDDDHEGADLEGERDGERDGQPVKFRFTVYGDCCSHTWIESVIEESALVGYTITAIDDLELPNNEPANGVDKTTTENYEEEMSFYGLAITTERGKCILDYRNSSNGYYGGSMDIVQHN
jgi:hypothetical protein